jgi:hypothetical protein
MMHHRSDHAADTAWVRHLAGASAFFRRSRYARIPASIVGRGGSNTSQIIQL